MPSPPRPAGGLETKLGVHPAAAVSRPAALGILSRPPVLLRFPPCRSGDATTFVLPRLHLQSTK